MRRGGLRKYRPPLSTYKHTIFIMVKNLVIAALFALVSSPFMNAQDVVTVAQVGTDTVATIVDRINANATSTVLIEQPAALNARLQPDAAAGEEQQAVKDDDRPAKGTGTSQRKASGYRVQVFSDSKAQSARNAAYAVKHQIENVLPRHRCYVIYNAPYWRVKVGDLKSRADADALADEIKSRFPAMSRNVRVVRDRVNVK